MYHYLEWTLFPLILDFTIKQILSKLQANFI